MQTYENVAWNNNRYKFSLKGSGETMTIITPGIVNCHSLRNSGLLHDNRHGH
ncbi:MAG: hypothetical protein FD123_2833 [Bacteroidetes bacterium]|nr:MAG: hypothetical protein FD123_2833 [Bacteroidota bacterium]